MKVLNLVLKKKWFDMIASGLKTEEYREIKPYWEKRLLDKLGNLIKYDIVHFSLGYTGDPKKQLYFWISSITTGKGNISWGAPEGIDVFIIKLGKRYELESSIN